MCFEPAGGELTMSVCEGILRKLCDKKQDPFHLWRGEECPKS